MFFKNIIIVVVDDDDVIFIVVVVLLFIGLNLELIYSESAVMQFFAAAIVVVVVPGYVLVMNSLSATQNGAASNENLLFVYAKTMRHICTAYQRLWISYIYSTILLLHISENSSLLP